MSRLPGQNEKESYFMLLFVLLPLANLGIENVQSIYLKKNL